MGLSFGASTAPENECSIFAGDSHHLEVPALEDDTAKRFRGEPPVLLHPEALHCDRANHPAVHPLLFAGGSDSGFG